MKASQELNEQWETLLKFIEEKCEVKLEPNLNDSNDKQISAGVNYWVSFMNYMKNNNDKWFIRDCYCIGFEDGIDGNFALMISGESDSIWVVKKGDLKIENPPVYRYNLNYESNKFSNLYKVGDTITGFFTNYLYDYSYMFGF